MTHAHDEHENELAAAVSATTPTQAEKAALFFDLIEEAKKAGKSWWADSQIKQIEMSIEQDKKIAALSKALEAASNALRSFQYGNGSTDFAKAMADFCDAMRVSARAAP